MSLDGVRLETIATNNPPSVNRAKVFYNSAAPGVGSIKKMCSKDEAGRMCCFGGFGIKDYRLIKVVNLTTTGTNTYTPSDGAQALYVEAIGGGGAGGGCDGASANEPAGSGGGAGAYSAVWVTGTLKSSYTYTVGAGGTGVSQANGNAGSDTTFDSPSICTAKAGSGGLKNPNAALYVLAGSVGGLASGGVGDILFDGCDGGWAIGLGGGTNTSQGGTGGQAPIVCGGARGSSTATIGNVGKQYGGGGGGRALNPATGFAGAQGIIRIWEFA